MKLVKEYIINEKFIENSDPVYDMGIGMKYYKQIAKDFFRYTNNETYRIRYKYFPEEKYAEAYALCLSYFFKFILHENMSIPEAFNKMCKEEYKHGKILYKKEHRDKIINVLRNTFKIPIYGIKESVNEKFTEDSDPIRDMGVGSLVLIKNWLKKMNINEAKYRINDDLTIDIFESLDLDGMMKGNFPDYIKFNSVEGYCDLKNNKLTSLRGCPEICKGYFSCANNKLKNLDYMPKEIRGTFNISNNNIKEVNKLPKDVKIRINAKKNPLITSRHMIRKLVNNEEVLIVMDPKINKLKK